MVTISQGHAQVMDIRIKSISEYFALTLTYVLWLKNLSGGIELLFKFIAHPLPIGILLNKSEQD